MAATEVLYRKEEGIGIITLNRPDKMNSLTHGMLEDLVRIEAEAILDDEVRAVIVTGAGRAFCAGLDMGVLVRRGEVASAGGEGFQERTFTPPETGLPQWTFTRIPKPTIAAVNGAAVGLGAELTIQCDIRIASENARFGWIHSIRGITPDTGAGPYLLPYVVGLSKACELIYSGETIDAWEAERIGLVSKVVTPEDLMPAAKEMALRLTRGAPLALKGAKELIYGSLEWPSGMLQEKTRGYSRRLAPTEDRKEGMKSFIEKRAPVWKGR